MASLQKSPILALLGLIAGLAGVFAAVLCAAQLLYTVLGGDHANYLAPMLLNFPVDGALLLTLAIWLIFWLQTLRPRFDRAAVKR